MRRSSRAAASPCGSSRSSSIRRSSSGDLDPYRRARHATGGPAGPGAAAGRTGVRAGGSACRPYGMAGDRPDRRPGQLGLNPPDSTHRPAPECRRDRSGTTEHGPVCLLRRRNCAQRREVGPPEGAGGHSARLRLETGQSRWYDLPESGAIQGVGRLDYAVVFPIRNATTPGG